MTTAPVPETPPFVPDEELIVRRQATLDRAEAQLKADFVGIDGIISELIGHVRPWYVMPEILSRPVIINLWGMTGVGKTDLVRRLVKYLDFQERFCEVDLASSPTIGYLFNAAGISDGKPAIVLFDEIQRYRSRGDGYSSGYSDLWELLSDGKLARRDPSTLQWLREYVQESVYEGRRRAAQVETGGFDVGPSEVGIYVARQFAAVTGSECDPVEIASWTPEKLRDEFKLLQFKKYAYEPIDHSKTLCIISGNLDEAFGMAELTSEADVDADIFAAYTSMITTVDIKNALTRRFYPEQVARMGNIHLIYRSLKRGDFETLIEREVVRICDRVRSSFGIEMAVDPSIHRLIYRNGVFPTQGVRPLFSSVVDVLDTHVTSFLFEAIIAKSKRIAMRYDVDDQDLIGELDHTVKRVHFVGRVDRIRQTKLDDVVANVAVHEAGHALVYAALFAVAPLQVTVKGTSSYAGGFTFPHQIHETREALANKVKVLLAGGIAEELVFGEHQASVGRGIDWENVTALVADLFRRYGFECFRANYALEGAWGLDRSVTDASIEERVASLITETKGLLQSHQKALLALAASVQAEGSLAAHEIAELLADHGLLVDVKPEGHLLAPAYGSYLERE